MRARRDISYRTTRFEAKGLGAIDMVSRALATLDLVSHDDARPACPAVHLEGRTVLSYGELAEMVGDSERALRHDSKALVLYAGDRDLPTLLAYLAALRLGHAVAPAVAHVFASAAGRPLVAYLTATDDVRTPEQAHARCMAVLAHHPTAITPRHYVICRAAPPDPADPAAWPTPVATGTGRPELLG